MEILCWKLSKKFNSEKRTTKKETKNIAKKKQG